jgi:hypothetical protein
MGEQLIETALRELVRAMYQTLVGAHEAGDGIGYRSMGRGAYRAGDGMIEWEPHIRRLAAAIRTGAVAAVAEELERAVEAKA